MKFVIFAIVLTAVTLAGCRRETAYVPIQDECKVYGVCEDEKFYK